MPQVRYELTIPLAFLVAAVACQAMAYRHLAPDWQSRPRAVVNSWLPKREFFTRTGWRLQLSALGLALVGLVTLMAVPAMAGDPDAAAERVQTEIVERFPDGLGVGRVNALLDSLGIEHSRFDSASGTIGAMRRNVFRRAFVHGDVQIEFVFDSLGLLRERRFRTVFTGP